MNELFIPIIIGLVEVVKRVGLPTKYLPLIALAFGLILSLISPQIDILRGIVFGLSAVGLFSGTKAVVKN